MVMLLVVPGALFVLYWWFRGSLLAGAAVWFVLVLVAGEVRAGEHGPPLLRWAGFALIAMIPFWTRLLLAGYRARRADFERTFIQ